MPQKFGKLDFSFLDDEQDTAQLPFSDLDYSFLEKDTTLAPLVSDTSPFQDLDFSFLDETPSARAPKRQEIERTPYASLTTRFFNRFMEGFTPFGLYESNVGRPENIPEVIADVAGGMSGFMAGFVPAAMVTGGVGVSAKAIQGFKGLSNAKQLAQAVKLMSKARKAKKVEDVDKYGRAAAAVLGLETSAEAIEKTAKIVGALPHASGLLARVPGYTNFILKASINSPKAGRALNAGISNIVSFGIHGQAHVPIHTSVEDRLKQLGADAAMGVVFTAASTPSLLGIKGPIKYAEPLMLFGIGAGSDLGKSDMTPTERIIHGLGLVAVHHSVRGLRKIGIEDKQIRSLQDIGFSYEQAYGIVKHSSKINDAAIEHAKSMQEKTKGIIFTNDKSSDPATKGKISIEVTPGFITKTKKGQFQLRGKYIVNEANPGRVGEDFVITGDSYKDVRSQFTSTRQRSIDKKGGHGFVRHLRDTEMTTDYDIKPASDSDIKQSKKLSSIADKLDSIRDFDVGDRGYDIDPKTGQVKLYVIRGGKKSYVTPTVQNAIFGVPTKSGLMGLRLTRDKAVERAENIWMENDNLISHSQKYRDMANIFFTPEQVKHGNAKTLARKAVRDTGIEKEEVRIIIKDFFPEAATRGREQMGKHAPEKKTLSFDFMTTKELDAFTAMFSPTTARRFLDNMAVKVPIDKYHSLGMKVRKPLARWRQIGRRQVLPFYTELRLLGAKAASKISLEFDLLRQNIAGEGTSFRNRLIDAGLKKSDIKLLSMEIDPIFKDGLRGELLRKGYADKEVHDIIKLVRGHTNYNYSYLAASNNQVRVWSKKDKRFVWKHIFELRDPNNNLIELAKPRGRVQSSSEVIEVKTTKDSAHKGRTYEGDIERHSKDLIILNTEKFGRIELKTSDIESQKTEWQKYRDTVVAIAANKGKKSAIKVVKDKNGLTRKIDYTRSSIFYEPHYITRILTPEARELLGTNRSFVEKLAEDIVDRGYDPEFVKLKDMPRNEKVDAVIEKLIEMNSFQHQKGVFGEQFGRIADLPPAFLQNRNGDYIAIDPLKNKYPEGRWGYNVKKGDKVVDINGKEHTVANIIHTYERNFDKVLQRHQQMVASIVPTYKYIGRGGAENAEFKTKYISSIHARHGDEVGRWVEQAFRLQVNGEMGGPVSRLFGKSTAFTAAIGLSSPLSGIKNILLGQTNLVAAFGLRNSLAAWGRLMTPGGWRAWKDITRNIGGTEAGVHELLTTSYSRYSPGFMRITEMANRISSAVTGEIVLDTAVKKLLGRKTPLSGRGLSKDKAADFIRQTFKLDPGKIVDRGYVTNSERAKAMQMAHLMTQGGPTMPFVPPWMAKQWAKPLTLFYRIAYRVTDHVVTNVMRPLIVRGNPMPMLKYAGAATVTGGALYSLYYNIMDKEVVNKFKGMPYQYWMQFIKGEGLAIMSNGFDQYGNVVESYQPVVVKTYTSLAKNMAYIIAGKKGAVEGTTDWLNSNVVIWNHSRQVYERFAKPHNKAYKKSKKQQRHWLEATFGTGWQAKYEPEDDYLTTRTPYYRHLKDIFWGDNPEDKARTYYAALAYVTHDLERQRASIGKSTRGARAEAKAILKRIISNRRPIPSAWKTRKKGEKTTMYRLYMSALTPEEQEEERAMERVYRSHKRDFWNAVRSYRKQYDFSR